MIYDCFVFFNEVELLDFRLKYLDKFVDFFVIVESKKTYTGKKKKLFYFENKKKYEKYQNKILHFIVDKYPKYESAWSYESNQRNAIFDLLKTRCKLNDIILISDVDEIPNLEKIPKEIKDGVVYCFLQDMYFYYLNTYKKNHLIWEGGTKMITYRTIKKNLLDESFVKYGVTFPEKLNYKTTASKIRLYRKNFFIKNGGWHFSYLGGVERIIKKLKSFSHQELINSGKFNKNYLRNKLKRGVDIFDPTIPLFGRIDKKIHGYFEKTHYFFLKNPPKESILIYYFRKYLQYVSIILRNWLRVFFLKIL